jgi:L-amino acid N-acyltransferase YncA
MSKTYPRDVTLLNGKAVRLRLIADNDRDAIVRFARSLPEDDLLFLRIDITQPDVVDEWLANVRRGDTSTVLACEDENIVGYASAHRTPARWTRRVGEVRLMIAPAYRRLGLGRILAGEIFDVARAAGVRKITVQMTPDQTRARSVFEHLGFTVEALLADWVEDRHGRTRDLLVMAHDLDGLTDTVHKPASAPA